MSTKTTYKRIALVAVASLTFGLVTSISAQAAISTTVLDAAITNQGNTGASTLPIPAGTALTADLNLTTDDVAVIANTGSFAFTVKAGSTGTEKDITATCTFAANTAIAANWTVAVTTATTGTFSVTAAAAAAGATYKIGTVSCPTPIGGVYKITAAGAFTTPAVTATNTAPTSVATGMAYVSGGNVTTGTIRNTTSGQAAVGGAAIVEFTAPTHTGNEVLRVTSSGVGSILSKANVTGGAVSDINGSTPAAGVYFTNGGTTALAQYTVTLGSAVAGTQTISVVSTATTTGVPTTIATINVTWGSPAGLSVGYSTVYISQGAAAPTATTNALGATLSSAMAGGTVPVQAATIQVTLKDANNVALAAGSSVSAVIVGPGLLGIADDQTNNSPTQTGRAVGQASLTDNIFNVSVWSDGTAGTGTISLYIGSTLIGTKSVLFYGAPASIKVVSQNLSIARASSAGSTLGSATAAPAGTSVATTPAVTLSVLDANGNTVPGRVVTGVVSDSTVLTSSSIVESNGLGAGDGYAGAGHYNASVTSAPAGKSGATATVTYRTLLNDGVTYISSPAVTFTLGGSVTLGTISVALDKTTYAPGDSATLTVTAKDSAGNPVYDQDVNLWGGLGSAPIWSKSVVGLTPSSTATASFIGGKRTYKGYVPSLEGPFSITGALDSLTVVGGATLTATATVEGGATSTAAQAAADAAAEATDAANAATDAANAAAEAADAATAAAQDAADAVAALSTQVSTLVNNLRKQITSLTNLVVKIQKKVRA